MKSLFKCAAEGAYSSLTKANLHVLIFIQKSTADKRGNVENNVYRLNTEKFYLCEFFFHPFSSSSMGPSNLYNKAFALCVCPLLFSEGMITNLAEDFVNK